MRDQNRRQDPLVQVWTCTSRAISSEIIQGVDYVVKYRQNDKNIDELPVMVKLLEDQEKLEFVRE